MAWTYTDTEYVKLYRKFIGWEWYQDVNTKVLFLHCLLRANWKPGRWQGIEYKAGQFITSLRMLSKETGLTVDQVRTAIKHLKATGEITDFSQANFRIITVKNWHLYQTDTKPNPRPVPDQSQTVPNRYKNYRTIEDKNMYTPHTPPTFEEVQDYCFQNGYQNTDIEAFMAYNEAQNWKMDWKKALVLWAKKDKDRGKRSGNQFANMIRHDDYDMDAIEAAMLGGYDG